MMMGLGQGRKKRLFTIFGHSVYAEISLVILLLLVLLAGSGGGPQGIIAALVFVVVALFSIVAHELGHAMAVRKLGYGTSTIVLHGLGGVCQWRGNANRKERILIALAGPGVNLVLGGVTGAFVLALGMPTELLSRSALYALLFANLGWAIFNLMPIWPLDGGHVLRYALLGRKPRDETVRLSLTVSMVTAGLLAIGGLLYGWFFVTILLGLIIFMNYRELQAVKGPPGSFYGY
jgi:stage IV sporulation protein FB